MLAHFDWAVYGFNSGHYWSTIQGRGLHFRFVLMCDPFVHGRALLRNLSGCKIITNTAPAMLDYVCGSGISSKLTGVSRDWWDMILVGKLSGQYLWFMLVKQLLPRVLYGLCTVSASYNELLECLM